MTITEPRFAAQLVTRTGRILPFDDVGGMAAFIAEGRILPTEVHSMWANSYIRPEIRLDATTAHFLRSDRLHTPMGSRLAAFPPGPKVDSIRAELGGEVLRWEEVLALPGRSADDEPRGTDGPQ